MTKKLINSSPTVISLGEYPPAIIPRLMATSAEKCGSNLSPLELINPHSTISGSEPVLKETKNWYLPLNEYQEWLKEWILDGHKEWRPIMSTDSARVGWTWTYSRVR